jgi:hypothetical protein
MIGVRSVSELAWKGMIDELRQQWFELNTTCTLHCTGNLIVESSRKARQGGFPITKTFVLAMNRSNNSEPHDGSRFLDPVQHDHKPPGMW